MIVMNLKLDNFLLFKDFQINMSYPKKIVGSTIGEEHLKDRPNFRYKKLIILMGANATGKTALGRIMLCIFNFIHKKEYSAIVDLIEDPTQPARFEIDFVVEDNTLFRVSTLISSSRDRSYDSSNISVNVMSTPILPKDNYEQCASRFEKKKHDMSSNYIVELEKVPALTWMFEFPFAS